MSVSSAPVVVDIRAAEKALPSVWEAQWLPKRRGITWYVVAYASLLLVALVMRLWDLDAQALHHDESLHAVYSWYLFEGRGYQHNPMMHGPFQFFGTAGIFALLGDSTTTARLLPAMFGTLLVAVPLLLRSHLGRYGALATSLLLAFSPTMLYYSRFARNDIYMAVWTLALIAFMWRYISTRQLRYLLFSSVVLALAFITKETAFMVVAILGFFLFLYAIQDVVPWVLGRKSLRRFSPAGDFLVLLVTLTLPISAAIIGLFGDRLGLVLTNPDWQVAPIGIPLGSGLYVAFFVGFGFILAALLIGLRWRPGIWLLSFAAFYILWVLLYTSFFTNFWGGLGSGVWQSLGYWVAQQDVARGGQPWYYYIVIGFNYEYLPMLFGAIALVVYAIKGNAFSRFLVYWAVATFIAYTYASEKMPWLLVGVSLPFIVLTGKYIGDMLERRPWMKAVDVVDGMYGRLISSHRFNWQAVISSALVVLFLVAGGWLLILVVSRESSVPLIVVLVVAVVGSGAGFVYVSARVAKDTRWALIGVSAAAVLLAFSLPSAFRAAYANSDVPVELLVYTQSAPDIPQIMRDIERLGEETGKGRDLRIIVDTTDGFSWPWAWYLRDYPFASYQCLSEDSGCSKISSPPDADVVLLAARSNNGVEEFMTAFGEPTRYKHRWWFPESYRGITPSKVWDGIRSRESWCNAIAYFVDRDFGQRIGSIDAYAYFPAGFTPTPVGTELGERRIYC